MGEKAPKTGLCRQGRDRRNIYMRESQAVIALLAAFRRIG
jgi:hypothetical protein